MMLEEILRKIKKINKEEVIIKMADEVTLGERIPTGSFGLDTAIGGGWPMGRVVTLWGAKGSTKTSLSLLTVANAQRLGKVCLYIDAEHSFDPEWAEKLGVDTANLFYIGRKNVDYILEALSSDNLFEDIDVCVVDSVSAIHSAKYLREDDGSIGSQAKTTKELITKLQDWNPSSLVILISQISAKNGGAMWYNTWTGGNALDHASSLIVGLHVSKSKENQVVGEIVAGDKSYQHVIGQVVRWSVDKSKISLPLMTGNYSFINAIPAIDINSEILEVAVRYGVVEQAGTWFNYKDIKAQGKKSFAEYMEKPDFVEELKNEIFKAGLS